MKKIFSLLFMSSIVFSCTSASTNDLTLTTTTSKFVTYTANVKAILDKNCSTTGCHNAVSHRSNVTLANYAQAKDAFLNRNALAFMESTSNPMPRNGNLPSSTIQIIKKWRDQGYLEK